MVQINDIYFIFKSTHLPWSRTGAWSVSLRKSAAWLKKPSLLMPVKTCSSAKTTETTSYPRNCRSQNQLEHLKAAKPRLESEKETSQKESKSDADSEDQGPKGNKEKANTTDPDNRIMKTRNEWTGNCSPKGDNASTPHAGKRLKPFSVRPNKVLGLMTFSCSQFWQNHGK